VLESSVYRVVSNVVENIQVFDGLFFAATRAVAEAVRFDQENFDGFHLYDLDFSFSAWLAGFRLAVCNDIDIIHDSRGNPPREVIEPYAHKFVAKHQRHFAPVQRVAWDIPLGYFGSIEEIRRAFSLLRQSLGAPQRSLAPPADRALAPRARFVWESLSKSEDANAATYFDSGNYELADMLARPPRLVLEIGCGAGGLGRHVKQKFPGVRVYGVELNRTAAEIAATRLDRVFVDSVDSLDLAAAGVAYGSVDTLLLGDVLEHLYDPWGTLVKLRPYLSDDAQVVASIPNSRNLALLSGLAEGDWQYQTAGLLDVTHIRFFTLAGMRRLFSETGYAVHRHHAVLDPRFEGLLREAGRPGGGGVRIGRLQLDHFTEQDVEELCAVQYRILAYPLRQPV
jgi:2-polyprenyl-3-methyl-5-hydroxy-6-metoxy-1,4-benzoquinol methylase